MNSELRSFLFWIGTIAIAFIGGVISTYFGMVWTGNC